MSKKLVIVESPAKAKTLGKILGRSYVLKASLGHIRDLPRSRLGVDVENDFLPKYVVPRDKTKLANEIKKAVKDASAIYLATDPDREGEAIAWHLLEITKPDKIPVYRVEFHEITEEAIKHAFKNTRELNIELVNAQQARRILDRLVGYKISPLLWKKIRRGLSAGRVQSVALKIIVERERAIDAFKPVEYWSIEADLTRKDKGSSFKAFLTGLSDGTKLEIPDQEQADKLKAILQKNSYKVAKVNTKKVNRQPAPPFITSTLQQEAWRKLRFSGRQTMAIAQQLYEGLTLGKEGSVGLITYMRTDSTRVADQAISETREFISEKYGKEYIPARARSFTKKVKGAQEAHEAIRPTSTRREPSLIKEHLTATQFKLYDLIWKRMVASQMAAAVFDNTSIDIETEGGELSYLLRASRTIERFPGFMTLYTESKDEDEIVEGKKPLPNLEKGDVLKLLNLFLEQHFTQPPPHLTEARLIKTLEQNGIGRPSTYAPILSTLQDREYVDKLKGSLKPTELGLVVNDMLVKHFADIVNIKFTAKMEEELDNIANDGQDWISIVKEFYAPLEKNLEKASEAIEKIKLPDEETDEVCPKCGKPMVVKIGRFGKFLACSGYPDCKSTKPYRIKTGAKCPDCGGDIIQRMSKKRRMFYGCSNYPDCKFITNTKPLPQPCPECGGLLTAAKDEQGKCVKCGWKGKLPQEEDNAVSV